MTNTNLGQQKDKTASNCDELQNEVINPMQLLQEIEPLLKDYFIGDFKIEDKAIQMNFNNGQKFRLTVGGVA